MKKLVKMRIKRTSKKKNQRKAKMSLKMKMKNQTLQLSKTIIRISNESEKYANMMKK